VAEDGRFAPQRRDTSWTRRESDASVNRCSHFRGRLEAGGNELTVSGHPDSCRTLKDGGVSIDRASRSASHTL
jgi:hypothetical protein